MVYIFSSVKLSDQKKCYHTAFMRCRCWYLKGQNYNRSIKGLFIFLIIMTSSSGNIFRVTGHLCGEFTGHRWIPRTKASDHKYAIYTEKSTFCYNCIALGDVFSTEKSRNDHTDDIWCMCLISHHIIHNWHFHHYKRTRSYWRDMNIENETN